MMRRVLFAAVVIVAAGRIVMASPSGQAPVAPGAQAAPAAQARPLPASPAGMAATQVSGRWVEEQVQGQDRKVTRYREGKWISVEYGRPILRGRPDIFGKGAEYGKTVNAGSPVWRAGANQTTRLKTEVPLVIGTKTVPAGEYSVFVDLKEGAWTLILSTQPYQAKYDPNNKLETWGSDGYDPKFDVARAPMAVAAGAMSVDEFTIGFVNMTTQGGTLAMWWDKTVATVSFTVGK
jgi:hypothetical protein